MKKMILKFSNSLLSKEDMKKLQGGYEDGDSACSTISCSNPSIPQDKGKCLTCGTSNGDCKITYVVGGQTYTYGITSNSCRV